MTTTQWVISVIVALIGGGAMGAVITALVTYRRNRRQPVVYTKQIIHIFRKGQNFPEFAKLILKEHPLGIGEERTVNNLSLARITFTNKGNQDIEMFVIGVTMEGSSKVVDVRMDQPDRHHVMRIVFNEKIELDKEPIPITKPDFTVEPFNRGETYKVDVYFTYEESPGEIKLSSPHSTQLVELPFVDAVTGLKREFRLNWIIEIISTIIFLLLGIYLGGVFSSNPSTNAPPVSTSSPASSASPSPSAPAPLVQP